jgi:hypothetical protein
LLLNGRTNREVRVSRSQGNYIRRLLCPAQVKSALVQQIQPNGIVRKESFNHGKYTCMLPSPDCGRLAAQNDPDTVNH